MHKPFHLTLFSTALLLVACAPARHVTGVLTYEALVHQKRDECMALSPTEKQQCLNRAEVSYWDSLEQVEELRRQREREGEKLPELNSDDRM